MKQPELGRKLSNLRKAKGMTQEELVAKCNLSVRTIQRIEAGEVTPRSYTIKALFEALEVEWEHNGHVEVQATQKELPASLRRLIRASIVGGIAFSLISIVEFAMEMTMANGSEKIRFAFYFPVKTVSLICYSLFLFAFLRIAKFSKNWMLDLGAWLMILVSLITSGTQLFFAYLSGIPIELTTGIVMVVSWGVVYLIFGCGLLKLDSRWKSVAGPVGILCMVTGCLLLTVLGAVIAMGTTVVAHVGMIYFLAWYSKNSARTYSPDSTFSPELQG